MQACARARARSRTMCTPLFCTATFEHMSRPSHCIFLADLLSLFLLYLLSPLSLSIVLSSYRLYIFLFFPLYIDVNKTKLHFINLIVFIDVLSNMCNHITSRDGLRREQMFTVKVSNYIKIQD